jgi:hypothetical protein
VLPKSNTLKVAALLSQFLYANKRMDLAGIGRFSYMPDSDGDTEKGKQAKQAGNISFTCDTGTRDDDDLISFISKQTGKMKTLATSDLHSFLELATEFLNIGKAFHIEGIGTLIKNTEGKFSFTQGHILNEKLKEPQLQREGSKSTVEEEPFKGYDDMYGRKMNVSMPLKRLLVPALILVGIGLAIWGGYFIYKSNSAKKSLSAALSQIVPDTSQTATVQADTSARQDSLQPAPALPQDTYKFVYETTASRKRALSRFKQVHELIPEIQMEALNDSSLFKIYILKATTDTSLTKQELKAWYYGTLPKYVHIEK